MWLCTAAPQHFLYLRPEPSPQHAQKRRVPVARPQGQGSLRPIFSLRRIGWRAVEPSPPEIAG